MEPEISKQQARLVALGIAKDIRAYVDDHLAEYTEFLKEYGEQPAPLRERGREVYSA